MVLELWGGPESTVNRVGDRFGDQLVLTGHHDRIEDIDRIAALNFDAVRYPLLWERASVAGGGYDWSWTDARLDRLRQAGARVIAGLVHHGSGPPHTNLLGDGFASGLGAYAMAAARRYPWIDDWTPVNEPVTTARFSGLYGIWYPHRRDEFAFWTALLNQVDGIRLAMRAVRSVNPGARLVQADDLGRTFATAQLRDQAGFDNARRWAGWDLLCGRLVPGHALFDRIAAFGFGDRLRAIADDPCPPDIIGINHYATSDRFLDHRFRRYPRSLRGGNGRMRYADVEAVRVLQPGPPGIAGALREAWDRYGIPLAVTEAHNGCTREEQMRWLAGTWDIATTLRGEGVDVRAVTSWALFGAKGWNTLLTGPGVYESGAFDVRSGVPRPTAIVPLLKALPGCAARHPAVEGRGWWRRSIRLVHATAQRPARMRDHAGSVEPSPSGQPLLICGGTGPVGRALVRACRHRDIAYVLTDCSALALDDPAEVDKMLARHRPWAVIDTGGSGGIDDDEAACWHGIMRHVDSLAAACARLGILCAGFSSDQVFDGLAGRPCLEDDTPRPLGPSGLAQIGIERALTAYDGLIFRTSALFSLFDDRTMASRVVRALSAGQRFAAAGGHVVTPTYVPHLADAVLDLLIDGEPGVRHIVGDAALSWAEFARWIARSCGLDERLVEEVSEPSASEPGLSRAILGTRFGSLLPPVEAAITAFAQTVPGR